MAHKMKSRGRAASRFVDLYNLIMKSTARIPSICPYSHLQKRPHPKVNSLLGSLVASCNSWCFSILFGREVKERGGKESDREGESILFTL